LRRKAASSSTATEAVLAYLRDGVVVAGCEDDVRLLGRLKRDFDYYCIELVEE
jgi:hypothetical protein